MGLLFPLQYFGDRGDIGVCRIVTPSSSSCFEEVEDNCVGRFLLLRFFGDGGDDGVGCFTSSSFLGDVGDNDVGGCIPSPSSSCLEDVGNNGVGRFFPLRDGNSGVGCCILLPSFCSEVGKNGSDCFTSSSCSDDSGVGCSTAPSS